MVWDLIADIGGTNTRLASVADRKIVESKTYPTKGDAQLVDMLSDFITSQDGKPNAAVLAAGGPVKADYFQLTNADKDLHKSDVQELCASENVRFINDFEAAAWSLATVETRATNALQGPDEVPIGHRMILGPGTGLGVGFLAHQNGNFMAVPGEGGHIGISPMSADDIPVFEAFNEIWPETRHGQTAFVYEAEAMLSGTGLPYLYQAVAKSMGLAADLLAPKEILAAAQEGKDEASGRTLEIFRRQLGKVAGDLAFACHTKGGVFLTGGVLLKNPWILNKDFIDSFNAGGRFTETRRNIPIYLYKNDRFGLSGAANALFFNPF